MLLGGLRLCSHFLRGRKIAYPSKLGIEVQLLCVNEDWWGILLSGGLGIIPSKVWMTNKAKSPRSSQNLFILFLFIYFFLRVLHLLIYLFIYFSFIFISWRPVTTQHCSGFCHTLTWISHGVTCIPHPDPPSHLPLHPIPLGLPSAPGPSTCLMHPTWAGDLFHSR